MENNKLTLLTEKLGVPENILEIAQKTYDYIILDLSKSTIDIEDVISYNIPVNDVISDMKISNIDININIKTISFDMIRDERKKEKKIGDIILSSMNISSRVNTNSKPGKITTNHNSTASLNVNLVSIELVVTSDSLLDFMKKGKDNFIASFAHELMHKYHHYKHPTENAIEFFKYDSYSKINLNIKAISDFTHYLYFTHTIENVVRPTEVASKIKSGNISNDKFQEFLNNESVYTMLKTIKNYRIEDLRNGIAKEMDVVNHIIENSLDGQEFNSDEAKIDKMLELIYISIVNKSMRSFKDFLSSSPLDSFFGMSDDKQIVFDKVFSDVTKYQNNINKFYTDTEKMFTFVGDKYLKKISKLYDMTSPTKDSIKDWDLHQKINNKVTERVETKILSFENFMRKK
jgi:hypothetical protein